ncbi:MAG: hypothetical protein AAGI30_03485 [Planctomycetota bacterium]
MKNHIYDIVLVTVVAVVVCLVSSGLGAQTQAFSNLHPAGTITGHDRTAISDSIGFAPTTVTDGVHIYVAQANADRTMAMIRVIDSQDGSTVREITVSQASPMTVTECYLAGNGLYVGYAVGSSSPSRFEAFVDLTDDSVTITPDPFPVSQPSFSSFFDEVSGTWILRTLVPLDGVYQYNPATKSWQFLASLSTLQAELDALRISPFAAAYMGDGNPPNLDYHFANGNSWFAVGPAWIDEPTGPFPFTNLDRFGVAIFNTDGTLRRFIEDGEPRTFQGHVTLNPDGSIPFSGGTTSELIELNEDELLVGVRYVVAPGLAPRVMLGTNLLFIADINTGEVTAIETPIDALRVIPTFIPQWDTFFEWGFFGRMHVVGDVLMAQAYVTPVTVYSSTQQLLGGRVILFDLRTQEVLVEFEGINELTGWPIGGFGDVMLTYADFTPRIFPHEPEDPSSLRALKLIDCDNDQIVDVLAQALGLDCDGNLVPDTCESEDLDGNGIPDRCDILENPQIDCNANGLIDTVEIAAGTTADCNENGRPDECDILGFTKIDIVMAIDDSGSMQNDIESICDQLSTIEQDFISLGYDASIDIYTIDRTPESLPEGTVTCSPAQTVVGTFGASIPGTGGQSLVALAELSPGGLSIESWGDATAILADRYPWRLGAARIIVPVSDEGPRGGTNTDGGCGSDDDDAITNAITVVNDANAIAIPIFVRGGCGSALAQDLADATQPINPGSVIVEDDTYLPAMRDIILSFGGSLDVDGNGRPDECPCTGDANGNGIVNVEDFIDVLLNFGGPGPLGDANEDGVVNVQDFIDVLLNFGLNCNAPMTLISPTDVFTLSLVSTKTIEKGGTTDVLTVVNGTVASSRTVPLHVNTIRRDVYDESDVLIGRESAWWPHDTYLAFDDTPIDSAGQPFVLQSAVTDPPSSGATDYLFASGFVFGSTQVGFTIHPSTNAVSQYGAFGIQELNSDPDPTGLFSGRETVYIGRIATLEPNTTLTGDLEISFAGGTGVVVPVGPFDAQNRGVQAAIISSPALLGDEVTIGTVHDVYVIGATFFGIPID